MKSDPIQYRFNEISVDPGQLAWITESQSLYGYQPPNSSEISELKYQVFHRVLELATRYCTERQLFILKDYYLAGYTQEEIAYRHDICQPTVHKTLWGNIDYSYGGRRYGGALKKLRKKSDRDDQIKHLMESLDMAYARYGEGR